MPRARLLLTIAVAALLLRLAWVGWSWQTHGPQLRYDDETLHWQLAVNLVTHGELIAGDGRRLARMPAYPLFLAAFAGLGDAGVLAARVVQCLLSAISVWIAGRWAQQALGNAAGALAAVLVAIDPYQVFFCNLLLTETPYITLSLAASHAVWQWLRNPGPPSASVVATAAVCGALALMTRSSAVLWLACLWLLPLLTDRPVTRYLRRAAPCGLVLAAMMLPWGLRNRAVSGHYAWLSANGGVTLYDGQGPQADGSGDQSFLKHMPELDGLSEVERDRLLRDRALQHMRSDPARVLRLAGAKFMRTWSPFPNVEEHRTGATAWASAAYTILLLTLAAGGLVRSGRRAWRLHLVVWMAVAYYTLLHCVYVGSLRYRIPLMPLIAVSAAGVGASRGRPNEQDSEIPAAPDSPC